MYKCIKTASIGSVVYIEGREYDKVKVTKHCKDYKVTEIKEFFEEIKPEVKEG